jgi:hypothetical protein
VLRARIRETAKENTDFIVISKKATRIQNNIINGHRQYSTGKLKDTGPVGMVGRRRVFTCYSLSSYQTYRIMENQLRGTSSVNSTKEQKDQLGIDIAGLIARFENSSGLTVRKIKLEREGEKLKVKVKAEL